MKGIRVFVVGPDGCGKTELINLISSAIIIDGELKIANNTYSPSLRIECGEITGGPEGADIIIREIQVDENICVFIDDIANQIRSKVYPKKDGMK